MKIAVLGNPHSWYFSDLQRAAARLDATALHFHSLPFSTIQAEVRNEDFACLRSANQPFGDFDAILVRTMPPGSLEQVIFRMNALHLHEQAGGLVLNCARSIEIAVDKYLSLGLLASNNLPVPETFVCQTSEDAMAAFEQLGNDAVIKPVFGGEGRGITRISDPALAIRAFRMLEQLEGVIYLQQYIDHGGSDIRVFVLGDQTFSMCRNNSGDWRTNISLGGQGTPYDAPDEIIQLAKRASRVAQAEIAGVDIVFTPEQRPVILEVNAVPGWRGLTRVTGKDIGMQVVQFLENRVRQHQHSTELQEANHQNL